MQSTCAHCGKSDKLDWCSGCKTYRYCNRECQKADWPQHKKICKAIKAEKIIFRAADTLQHVWYAFREATFDKNYVKIVDEGEFLYLHEGQMDNIPGCIGDFFFRFPTGLVKNERDKKAVLSAYVCEDVIALMHDFFQSMLQGLDAEINEVNYNPKRILRSVKIIHPDRSSPGESGHIILRVTHRPSKKKFAVDPCGAQFDIMGACGVFEHYEKAYIHRIAMIHPSGTIKDELKRMATWKGRRGFLYKVQWDAAAEFDKAVARWGKEQSLTLPDFMKLPEEAYRTQRQKMLDVVTQDLKKFVARSNYTLQKRAALRYDRQHPGVEDREAARFGRDRPLIPFVTEMQVNGQADFEKELEKMKIYEDMASESEMEERHGVDWYKKMEGGMLTQEDMLTRKRPLKWH